MKLGKAWDAYIHHLYDPEFDYQNEIVFLQLTPQQHAKISALVRDYEDLEIQVNTGGLLGCQYKIHVPIGQEKIVGIVDRAFENHITKTKPSTRPDFYLPRENVAYQAGTYFMGNDQREFIDVAVARLPALKTGKGKHVDETPEAYEERCYGDILSRPAYYFFGLEP